MESNHRPTVFQTVALPLSYLKIVLWLTGELKEKELVKNGGAGNCTIIATKSL